MSNLKEFYGKSYPIGSILSLPYKTPIYNAPDGSVWYAITGKAPFAYTSDWSHLPNNMISPHPELIGPETDGCWLNRGAGQNANLQIAYRISTPLYVTSTYNYDVSQSLYYYYTSEDGVNWTKRYFPNSLNYSVIEYTAGKFIAIALNNTTNAVITSTDGINWSSANGISMSNVTEIVSDGANNITITPNTSTGGMCSNDGGATWISSTYVTTGLATSFGSGVMTWNAGASLFIGATSTAGGYQTSPTGQTWTARNAIASSSNFSGILPTPIKFASNATTTVAFGSGGFYLTTTDGINWTNNGFIPNCPIFTATQAYYDGTRFVVRYGSKIFYSTDTTTWTEGALVGGIGTSSFKSNGIMFGLPVTPWYGTKILKISDVTATQKQTVIPSIAHSNITATTTYTKLR